MAQDEIAGSPTAGKWQTRDVRPGLPDSVGSIAQTCFFSDVHGNLTSSARSFPVHCKGYKPNENETGDTLSVVLSEMSDVSEILMRLFLYNTFGTIMPPAVINGKL